MTIQRELDIQKGMEVYAADGSKIGRVAEVHGPVLKSKRNLAFPAGTQGPVVADDTLFIGRVDLDVTGTSGPLTGGQPTQAEIGVDSTPDDIVEDVARTDVGTDYKQLGEAGAPSTPHPAPGGDPRDVEGYFKLGTGLLSTDLFVPMSAVQNVSNDRVTLNLGRNEINDSGWETNPRSGG